MAPPSAAELAQMEKAEQALSEQMLAAEAWALAVRVQLFKTDAQKAALKAIADERKRFDTWRTVWKQWAQQGQEPDGYSYPVSFWVRIGNDIASALKDYTGNLYKGSLLAVEVNTAVETAHQVVTPSAWPTWLKVTVGVGALVAALVVVNNVAGIARSLRG